MDTVPEYKVSLKWVFLILGTQCLNTAPFCAGAQALVHQAWTWHYSSVEFPSMSESTHTSQADLCDVKNVPVLFFPFKQAEKTWHRPKVLSPHPPPPSPLFLHSVGRLMKNSQVGDKCICTALLSFIVPEYLFTYRYCIRVEFEFFTGPRAWRLQWDTHQLLVLQNHLPTTL